MQKLKCPCEFCMIMKKERELLSLDSTEFKKRALALPDLTQEMRDGISNSDMTFINIFLGIAPEGMDVILFMNILQVEHFAHYKAYGMPIIPIVQESWSATQVADWLIYSHMVPDHLHSILRVKLDGKSFIEGRVKGILPDSDLAYVNSVIWGKARNLADYVHRIATSPSCIQHSAICRFFNVDPKRELSMKEIESIIREKYSLSFQLPEPVNPIMTRHDLLLAKTSRVMRKIICLFSKRK
jgi:hypothetical protein